MEVEDFHTFYIGNCELLVHNEYNGVKFKDIYKNVKDNIKNPDLKTRFENLLNKLEDCTDKKLIDEFNDSFKGVDYKNANSNIKAFEGKLGDIIGKYDTSYVKY